MPPKKAEYEGFWKWNETEKRLSHEKRKKKMIHIDLFSGIGGFALAAHWAGWRTLVTCEIDSFCRKILQYHFPKAYHHDDIHTLTYETIDIELSKRYGTLWRNEDIVLTGGFP